MDVHIEAQVERSTDPLKFRITIGEEFAVGIRRGKWSLPQ